MESEPPSPLIMAGSGSLNKPKDWQSFERLCRDLVSKLFDDPGADLHGRSGQRQHGVDILAKDPRTDELVGIQCKHLETLRLGKLVEMVNAARRLQPPIDRLLILTTASNDRRLQEAARKASATGENGAGLQVDIHGWDWIEAQLRNHSRLAIEYGLVALAPFSTPMHPDGSEIDQAIGARLREAIQRMNERRAEEDRFTIPSLARHLGYDDWRRIENIASGRADVRDAELCSIARRLGVSSRWLIEGKDAPFLVDPFAREHRDARRIHREIALQSPLKVVFVRNADQEEGRCDSTIVVQIDPVSWVTSTQHVPVHSHVGGGGRRDMVEFCCLLRRLHADLDRPGVRCHSTHVESQVFWRLLDGEIYPGSLFEYFANDCWSLFFSELDSSKVRDMDPGADELREAIRIVSWVLREERQHRGDTYLGSLFDWAGL